MSRYANITPVAQIETARLLVLFNLAHRKNTTKFASRAKGEAQVQDLIDNRGLFDGDPAHFIACPTCYSVHLDDEGACTECGWKHVEVVAPVKAKKAAKPASGNVRLAIAESWKRQDVRDARVTRNAVVVAIDGKIIADPFRSVKQAFQALDLPLGVHIRFRMELKEAGTKEFEHNGVVYTFGIA